MSRLHQLFPVWATEWLDVLVPATQIAITVLLAIALHYGLRRLIGQAGRRYNWPLELVVPVKGLVRWFIIAVTVLVCLEMLGVSAMVLWTAFSGFAAVGAVAFFAAWSVLSNFFCTFLIFAVRPYRLGDTIEVLDALDKTGVRGRVVDINMVYTTLEAGPNELGERSLVQLPNIFAFQKAVRRILNPKPLPQEQGILGGSQPQVGLPAAGGAAAGTEAEAAGV